MSETPTYKKVVDIIGVSIALFGVPTYFVDQYIDRQERKVNKALSYIEILQSGNVLETRLSLYSKWSSSPNLTAFLQSKPSEKNLERLVVSLVKEDQNFGRDIVKVANVFDTIYFCVESRNCAVSPLQTGAVKAAESFLGLYGPYLDYLSNEGLTSGTGSGLQKLAALKSP